MNDIQYILRLISKAKTSIEEAERSIEHAKDALSDIEDFLSSKPHSNFTNEGCTHTSEVFVPKVHPQIKS
jgi:outer membrane protein assembly factor BamD (BamD/ComL family)